MVVALTAACTVAAGGRAEAAGASLEALPDTTFRYTGGAQAYVVPDGVVALVVDVAGAAGAGAAPNGPDPGGWGGEVAGVLAVRPGQVLTVVVGGSGAKGGFNGGGAGGASAGPRPPGWAGGGASDIGVAGGRLVVAGGGGGARTYGGGGGAGGATPGRDGTADPGYLGRGGSGGGAGTPAAAGAGGQASCLLVDCPDGDGRSGDVSAGGAGGSAGQNPFSCNGGGGGGGGGGGWYGGGGGAAGDDCFGGAGGGGGASRVDPTAMPDPVMTPGANGGDGYVTIAPVRPRSTAGGFAFDGTATLPRFPCGPPPPFGDGPCQGTFAGDWHGHLTGSAGADMFEVTWSTANGAATAAFDYAEWQCLGLEAVVGLARGTGGATAGPGQVQGRWQVVGENAPRDVYRVDLTFGFDWTRVGTATVLALRPVLMTLWVTGLGPRAVVTTPQTGAAAFVPTTTNGSGAPTCGSPISDVKGTIAGVVPVVALSS